MKELSTANEKLRAQLLEKEGALAVLQATVTSLESRLCSVAQDTAGTLPVPAADQTQDFVGDVLHRVVSQLTADSEELDIIGQTVDQVDVPVISTVRVFICSL